MPTPVSSLPFKVVISVGPHSNTVEGYITTDSSWKDLSERQIQDKIKEAFRLALSTVIKTRRTVNE